MVMSAILAVGLLLLAMVVLAGIGILRGGWRVWRLNRGDQRLNHGKCPQCEYPLRFNGSEYWCSECGYRHPVRADRPSD